MPHVLRFRDQECVSAAIIMNAGVPMEHASPACRARRGSALDPEELHGSFAGKYVVSLVDIVL